MWELRSGAPPAEGQDLLACRSITLRGAGEEVEQAFGRVGTETHLEDPFWQIWTTLDISAQITDPEVARMVSQVTNRILA
jgi:hypothetical protein